MPLPKLTPSARMGDQVFHALHAAIMAGELPAGHRLRIRELAEDLGTSVMPVREAIRRLEETGLAEALPYRGAVVRSLSPEELLHIYTVRRLLEVEAVTQGAPNVTESDIQKMKAELADMERALADRRIVDYLDHDEKLLSTIYEASGNPVLVETIRTLWQRCRSYKIVGAEGEIGTGDVTALSAFQERLVAAAQSRDADQAKTITSESLDAAIGRIREALSDQAR